MSALVRALVVTGCVGFAALAFAQGTGPSTGPSQAPAGATPAVDPKAASPFFVDGNFVGFAFPGLGKSIVQRVDNISLLCVDSLDSARRRLRAGGAPVTQPNGMSQPIDAAAAGKMAELLDALVATRRADIEELGLQLAYNRKRMRARVAFLCDDGLFSKMGLKRDDFVMQVGDRAIAGRESAAVALKYVDEAPAPTIVVQRNGDTVEINTVGHERAVKALLVVMSRTLAMVPDPADPRTLKVGAEPAP